MAVGSMFTRKRLSIGIAFGVLLAAAFGAGCNGFFQPNALTAIAIQPPTPSIQVGLSQSLQAWGTYQDNTRNQITSGLIWSTSDDTVISIDTNTGNATAQSGGTATITASAQGLSATATATAFYGTISNFVVCQGVFNSGVCPAPTWTQSASAGGSQNYYAKGTYTNSQGTATTVDVTTVTTFTVSPSSFTAGNFSCTTSASPAVCTVTAGTLPTGAYTITVTYPTGSLSQVINVNLTP
jgi:Bacterial Ig-like domain (group 2)